jgi:hypothetical protein
MNDLDVAGAWWETHVVVGWRREVERKAWSGREGFVKMKSFGGGFEFSKHFREFNESGHKFSSNMSSPLLTQN